MINALHLWRFDNPEQAETMLRRTWVAGLMEEIIAKYGDRSGCRWVEGIDPPDDEDEDVRPADQPGEGRGGSHQGMVNCSTVLAGSENLTGRHFVANRENRGNCVLCYHCRPDKVGQKQVVTYCEECWVMLHVPECFKEWHTKQKPKSPFV